jgi:hypothetical protein
MCAAEADGGAVWQSVCLALLKRAQNMECGASQYLWHLLGDQLPRNAWRETQILKRLRNSANGAQI